jgi:3-hydroxyisobutyrate dehydrogenase-like beta-hydroxyacid dehydrogenase
MSGFRIPPEPSVEPADWRIGLIGYGEVGQIFAAALKQCGVKQVTAFDRLLTSDAQEPAMRAHAHANSIVLAATLAEAVAQSDLVISAVTASEAFNVAREVAATLRAGTWMMDVNSASVETKVACSQMVDAAGGFYVEAAVMTSIPPYGIRVPMLLGGPYAWVIEQPLTAMGFCIDTTFEKPGVASAIKMCRSIMIKGMEALVLESFTSARAYGVEQHVLDSLAETFPAIDWEKQGDYFFSRVIQHGKRRAEEMREVAKTVSHVELQPWMATATAERQAWAAQLAAQDVFEERRTLKPWRERADAILKHVDGAGGLPMPFPRRAREGGDP